MQGVQYSSGSLYLRGEPICPTTMGFLQWQATIQQPTLKFMAQLTLNFALAIYVQRVEDRNNDEQ